MNTPRPVVVAVLLASFCSAERAASAAQPEPLSGFVDLNGYYDSRHTATFTANVLVHLPWGFQYFSLTNIDVPIDGIRYRRDGNIYSEQNIRFKPLSFLPLQLAGQAVVRTGSQNDLVRGGARWAVSNTYGLSTLFSWARLTYFVSYYGAQTGQTKPEGWQSQFEHVYRWNVVPDRLYLSGFVDHNLWLFASADSPWSKVVTEHQVGLRVVEGLHLIAEVRLNQYLDNAPYGVGLGVQYLFPVRPK